jgi:hypothetical protein
MVDKSREQTLVNVIFEVTIRMQQGSLEFTSREQAVAYVADQLRKLGFDTYPCGISWGVLR